MLTVLACWAKLDFLFVRVLIISDLHGNLEAVEALPKDFDLLWVLGDLVNYGPNPAEVIQFVRKNAAMVVRGNHDHSLGFGEDPRCSVRFRAMAEETGRFTRSALSAEDVHYLGNLPLKASTCVDNTRFLLCHATPSDTLFEYRREDSTLWLNDEVSSAINVVLVGHTHLPFYRPVKGHAVVNPGSVGQPKHGRPEACYATWEDGKITLGSAVYEFERTVQKLGRIGLSARVYEDLASVLRTGKPP